VTLVASEDYRGLAERNRVEFAALASKAEMDRLLHDPDFWHPLKCAIVGARWGIQYLPRHYELLAGLAREGGREGRVVFVASPGLLAARMVQEKLAVPMASVVLQPWMIASSSAPPVMPAGLTLPRWAPRPLGELYWRGMDAVIGIIIGQPLNALRRELGLAPVRRLFKWWLSPELVLGMFPDQFGPPQDDWPVQVRLVGFPLFDSGGVLSGEVAEFCAGGEPPIAFTFGTGMMHAAGLFRAGVAACRMLGRRGIFLTRHARQLPVRLPSFIKHVEFAPFRELFPRCAAVVHHGGVGTVAEGLAAGVPQLVLPIAYDQKDNAVRVKGLGAGDWIAARRATGDRIARALGRLISKPRNNRETTSVPKAPSAFELAAHHVEQLATAEPVPVSS
jgi:UDP:flavonoid glycosyltransferase YjiC (YdhE family)